MNTSENPLSAELRRIADRAPSVLVSSHDAWAQALGARRSQRSIAVMAAAVVTVMVAALALAAVDRPAAPQPADRGAETPVVPSIFGLTRDQAVARLESGGLEVSTTTTTTCEADGLALSTSPPADGVVPDSQQVVLTWNDLSRVDLDCPEGDLAQRGDAFAFLGFLAGTGPAPDFAPAVEAQLDDGPPLTLSGDELTDPLEWYGGTALRTTIRERLAVRGAGLETRDVVGGSTELACGTSRPAGTDGRTAETLILSDPRLPPIPRQVTDDGGARADLRPCATTIDLYRNVDGAIDAIAIGTEARGYVSQPSLLVDDRLPADVSKAAKRLRKFAQGAPAAAPALADEVSLLAGGRVLRTVSRTELANPDDWSACAGICTPLLAPLSGVSGTLEVVERPDPILCPGVDEGSLRPATETLRRAVIQPVDNRDCDTDFRLAVYVDEDGAVAAVDLVRPS